MLPANSIVVNKSTVPVGSAKVVERVLGRHDVSVVSNPEFLREGSAVTDFLKVEPGGDGKAEGFTYAVGVFRRDRVDVIDGKIVAKSAKK